VYYASVGDLNSDGIPDVVTGNYESSRVGLFLGNGDGTFQAVRTLVAGANPLGVVVVDLNGDHKADIASADHGGGTMSVLLGNGDGTFQTAVSYATGVNPYEIMPGDFNRDGVPDLAVANHYSHTIGVFQGKGDGTFRPVVPQAVGLNPKTARVGDLNGDGLLDIVSANWGSSTISVLAGRGNGEFETAVNYAVGSNPSAASLVDVDGNETLDVVAANYSSNTVSILKNLAAPANPHLEITAPATVEIGTSFTVTITAKDGLGQRLTNFTGTVHFASSDSLANLPSDYVFTPLDAGIKTFQVTLNSLGNRSIFASEVGRSENSGEILVNVRFGNQPPTPHIGGPYQISEGDSLTLDASGSTDPDDDPLTYAWELDGDDDFSDAYGVQPTLTWSDLQALGIVDGPSSRDVRVRVADGQGHVADSAAVQLTVVNTSPTIDLSGATAVLEGSVYTLSLGAVTDPGADTVTSYIVHWGDGTSDIYAAPGDVTHTYADGQLATGGIERIVTLAASDDTFITDADGLGGPYSTHGTDTNLWSINYFTPGGGGSLATRPMFHFDLSEYEGRDATGDAKFRAHIIGPQNPDYYKSSSRRVDLYQIMSPWDDATVTFSAHPGIAFIQSQWVQYVGDTNQYIEWTIPQAVVQGWLDAPSTNHGVMIVNELPDAFFYDLIFASVEHPSNRPAQLSLAVDGRLPISVDLVDEDGTHTNAGQTLVRVENVAPTANVTGPDTGFRDEAVSFVLGASDVSSVDQASPFTWRIDWEGDGTVDQTVQGLTGLSVNHTYTVSGTYTLRVTATDKDGGVSSAVEHPLKVVKRNKPPTDLNLSSSVVAENQEPGTQVGDFTTVDPNAEDTFTYALVAGTGDADNSRFTILGNTLQTAVPFDFGLLT
jgi:hypothetical protein